jgi:glucosamine-6-phosphate deaminase
MAVEESRKFEKVRTSIYNGSEEGSLYVAEQIANLIRERQKEGRNAVIGLATGSTPAKVYEYLIQH